MTTLIVIAGIIALAFALYLLIGVVLPDLFGIAPFSISGTYLDPTRDDTDEITALRAGLTKYRNAATPRGKAEAPAKIAALGTQIDTAKGYAETAGYGVVEPIEGSWMLSNDPHVLNADDDDLATMARTARKVLATAEGLSDTEIVRLREFATAHPEPIVAEARKVSVTRSHGVALSESGRKTGPSGQSVHTLEAKVDSMNADMLVAHLHEVENSYNMCLVGFSFQTSRAILEGCLNNPSDDQAYRRRVAFDAIREHFEPKVIIDRCSICQVQILREHRAAHLATHSGGGRTSEIETVTLEPRVSLAHAQIMPEAEPVAQIEGSLSQRTAQSEIGDLDANAQPYPYEVAAR